MRRASNDRWNGGSLALCEQLGAAGKSAHAIRRPGYGQQAGMTVVQLRATP
ncbi:hypothetical protein ACI2LF_28490 [Kribbella sp. NPDC020789]